MIGALIVSVLVMTPVIPAHADEDSIRFSTGEGHATLGPNEVVRIDGRLRYFNNCSAAANAGGVDDFVYPAADIYVIDAKDEPADGDPLTDVAGTPTTIVQAGGTFVDEILAITQPSGSLPEGDYSIVVDTCQNGVFNAASDTLLHDMITVAFPPELPPIDQSILALKNNAHTQWGNWQEISRLFDTLLNVDKAAGCGMAAFEHGDDLEDAVHGCLEVISIWVDSPAISTWIEQTGRIKDAARCAGDDAGACFGLISAYWGLDGSPVRTFVTSGAKNLIANQARTFFGIYADPPRTDFTTATSVVQPDLPIPQMQGDGPVFDTMSSFATALEREQLMWTALLAAIERYQGAQAAGDTAAAVAQARSAANLADTLADAAPVTAGLLDDWFGAVQTAIPDLTTITQTECADARRVLGGLNGANGSGLTPAEDQALRNWGNAGATRATWLDQVRANGLVAGGLNCAPLENLGPVAAVVNGQADQSALLHSTADALRGVADGVIGPAATAVPVLALPSTTAATVGAPVSLTATASAGSTVAWDLDGDGAFDDATGATAVVTYQLAGHRVVAATATNAAGVAVTAHALVDVTASDEPPVIDAFAPSGIDANAYATTAVGDSGTFMVQASDPEGQPLRYDWFVDGVRQDSTDPALTLTTTADLRGPHTVSVQVQDPHPGNVAEQAWRWQVDDPDHDHDGWADNTVADCNDGNAAVHPRQAEVLFNHEDDDCDTATPDEPIDLGTGGEVWTWGDYRGNAHGGAADLPASMGVTDAVQISAFMIGGNALRSDGTVWGWGDGNGSIARLPGTNYGPMYGLGSTSGELAGVTAITETTYMVPAMFILLSDGHVASVGCEGGATTDGQLGAGAALNCRDYPDYVLGPDTDGDGHPDPLSDVVKVWNVGGAGLAQQSDGTLLQWGRRQCAGTWGYRPISYTAVVEPELTAALPGLVQAIGGSNNDGAAMFRLADGRVFACGEDMPAPTEAPSNRIEPFGDFGPADPAVDVAVSNSADEFWVVTASGKVWVKGSTDFAMKIAGCTPATCPGWKLFSLPLPPGAPAVDVETTWATWHVRRADGTLLTWGAATAGSSGHPDVGDWFQPYPAKIDGFVLQNYPSSWNGVALVLPSARVAASGWVPPQPAVHVSAVAAIGPEGGSAVAAVELDRPATGDLVVSWRFGDVTGDVTVPAGQTRADVPLALPEPDGVWGVDRHASLLLTGVSSNAVIGAPTADVTIVDADPAPELSFSPSSSPEGNDAITSAPVTLQLSRPAGVDVSVRVTSADGTATSGTDYKPLDVTIPVPAGATTATVPLVLRGNTQPQPNRALTLTASATAPDAASAILPATGSVTVFDDDPITLRASSTVVSAGDTASIEVSSPFVPEDETASLSWNTVDGTALAGRDYTPSSGTFTLSSDRDGAARGTITVPTALLTAAAPAEQGHLLTIALALTSGSRAVVAPDGVTVLITRELADGPTPTPTPTPTSTPGPGTPTPGATPAPEVPGGGEPGGGATVGAPADGALPGTGAVVPVAAIVAGALVLLAGAALLLGARRRRQR